MKPEEEVISAKFEGKGYFIKVLPDYEDFSASVETSVWEGRDLIDSLRTRVPSARASPVGLTTAIQRGHAWARKKITAVNGFQTLLTATIRLNQDMK